MEMPGADVIVLDPPRKGCDRACLQAVIETKAKRVVYISCDSATLARDLRILCDNGYELCRARPVDQFGQTVHVEVVCCLVLKNQ
jgi:23S rRNA (uracil1939-C5)-methyltransferase